MNLQCPCFSFPSASTIKTYHHRLTSESPSFNYHNVINVSPTSPADFCLLDGRKGQPYVHKHHSIWSYHRTGFSQSLHPTARLCQTRAEGLHAQGPIQLLHITEHCELPGSEPCPYTLDYLFIHGCFFVSPSMLSPLYHPEFA